MIIMQIWSDCSWHPRWFWRCSIRQIFAYLLTLDIHFCSWWSSRSISTFLLWLQVKVFIRIAAKILHLSFPLQCILVAVLCVCCIFSNRRWKCAKLPALCWISCKKIRYFAALQSWSMIHRAKRELFLFLGGDFSRWPDGFWISRQIVEYEMRGRNF